jgi:hypothetical protein
VHVDALGMEHICARERTASIRQECPTLSKSSRRAAREGEEIGSERGEEGDVRRQVRRRTLSGVTGSLQMWHTGGSYSGS